MISVLLAEKESPIEINVAATNMSPIVPPKGVKAMIQTYRSLLPQNHNLPASTKTTCGPKAWHRWRRRTRSLGRRRATLLSTRASALEIFLDWRTGPIVKPRSQQSLSNAPLREGGRQNTKARWSPFFFPRRQWGRVEMPQNPHTLSA